MRRGGKLFLVAFVVTLLGVVAYIADVPLLTRLELKTQDLRMQEEKPSPASSRIVLVVVDGKSLDAEGGWPWPRSKLAALVTKLSDAGAKVIAFDMFFPKPQTDEADLAFVDAVRQSKADVVLGYYFRYRQGDGEHVSEEEIRILENSIARARHLPMVVTARATTESASLRDAVLLESNIPGLSSAAASVGYTNLDSDGDGVCRSIPGVVRFHGSLYPPLSVVIAARYVGSRTFVCMAHDGVRSILVGNIAIPTDRWGSIVVNQRHCQFPTVSATDVLVDKVPAATLAGKIAMIGATAPSLHDAIVTPRDTALPGVALHASVVDSILDQDFISRPSWRVGLTVLCLIAGGLLTGVILSLTRVWAAALVSGALLTGYVASCCLVFSKQGMIIDLVYPVAVCLLVFFSVTICRLCLKERSAEPF